MSKEKLPKVQMIGKIITLEFESQEMAEAYFKGVKAMLKTIQALRDSGEFSF